MAGSSPRRPRAEFSDQDRDYMIKYLAKYTADPQGRSGNEIWKTLLENKKRKWNWAHRHTWQSWRNHYTKDKEWFDYKVRKYQKKNPTLKPLPSPRNGPSSTPKKGDEMRKRVPYTDEDDAHLAEYLAEHSLGTQGRLGIKLYQTLVANVDKWPWASRHTYQSWRERYSNRRWTFDRYIEEYQRDHPTGAIFETPAGARKGRQKTPAKALPEEDEAIPEENEEQEDAEAGEERDAVDEVNEVEDAVRGSEGGGEHNVTGRADGPSKGNGAEKQAREKRRRSNGTRDDAGGLRKSKRRRVDGYAGAEEPALAAVEENAAEQGKRAEEADAVAAGNELQVKPHTAKRGRGAKEKPVGASLPSDDYSGNIFDASESSDSETEAEEDGEEEQDPPMAVKRGEEEEEDEEEEDQLASSIDGSAQRQRMDVDVDRTAIARRGRRESISPEGTPSPTTVGRAQISQAQLYPTLSSPPQPLAEVDDLPLPGQFPATSTADVGGDSVLSEAIPLAHELLVKSEEETKPLMRMISQNPTPPASSPLADVKSKVERSQSLTPLRRSLASDAVADPAQPGPSAVVDTTPRAPPRQSKANDKFIRKPSEDIFGSVATTPVLASSRDVTPTVTEAQERRLKRPREPPRLQEGPYNHVFTDAMARTRLSGARATGVAAEDDSDREDGDAKVEDWPPRRGRDKGKGKEQSRPTLATSVMKVKIEPQESTAAMHQLRGLHPRTHHPFSQPTQDPEASQAQYSQSQHHPFSQPSQRFIDAEPGLLRSSRPQAESVPSFKLPKAHLDRLERELNKHGHLLQAGSMRNEDQRASIITSTPVRRHLTGPSRADDPIPGPSNVGHTAPQSPSRSPELGRSVRFDMTLPDIKGKGRDYGPSTPHVSRRRHTFEGGSAFQAQFREDRPSGDHIRVRQSLPLLPSAPHGVRSADDSLVGTTSNSFSFRRPYKRESLSFVQQPKRRSASVEPELPIQISEDDESVVVHIGVETAIQTMSENHGFNPEIVRRVWSQTQSLRMTDTILRQMREAAEKAARQFVENLGAGEGGFTFDIRPNARVRSIARDEAPRRSSHNRDASILRITPVDADTKESLQYSPPRPTRAGQYARLVKEGRRSEAISREVSRAAGISISQTPQKDGSHADYEAVGGSPDRHDTLGSDRNPGRLWLEGRTANDSQRSSAVARRSTAGDAAKIALGKKLGRMLANVNA
ncbi:hypothetical protein DAEQUDRAFT_807806 [Daedalea quercina L-15889]|uniref:TERF2-interacting telomeric protein 1 Myb domain-containing protein n=1 Tax=Daedalea quercina L-15889 TaxID=1314783 RepID=A0A165TXT0_9APHY|nr:hypothetical protein DAEQUDRAFT_807806 [Daedalea quercina L-15889]